MTGVTKHIGYTREENQRLRAEIERLRTMNLKQSLDVAERFEQKDAEIERLRTDLREFRNAAADELRMREDVAQTKRHEMCLMEEIERLKAALQRIADMNRSYDDAVTLGPVAIARAALKEKT